MAIDNIMTVVEKITENSSRCDNVFIFYRFSFFFKIYHGRYYFFFHHVINRTPFRCILRKIHLYAIQFNWFSS